MGRLAVAISMHRRDLYALQQVHKEKGIPVATLTKETAEAVINTGIMRST
jgi:hypothetical protein